jgi:EAL domain-containing protein (putative c-di-GMP-specific phosphodiesterase class I)
MYMAKRNGRARYELFEPEMGSLARRRLELEQDLRRALERKELELHYQPVINLCDGSLAGFEALLRWQHPTRGWIAPDIFVPVAEETGLIVPVGSWALREACRQLRAWQDDWPAARDISVSVNLSGRQFKEPGLAAEVESVLIETGLAPECLNLEITETIMMADESGTSAILRELEQLGVTLAIDDFGTGYSSLGTLRHFPVNSLKIDRSFVNGLGAESDDSVIVSGVVGLAHGLGLRVVAEGVETADQLARLHALGCDLGQGYHFARPLPPAAVLDILATSVRSVAAD